MLLHTLEKDKLISPPRWLPDNTAYLTAMGSVAYGVSGDMSDVDIYGFAMPPKDMVFPHLAGHIPGFGPAPPKFECWEQHHVQDKSGKKEYDFQVFSIVRFFHLLVENNPNMTDSLFTPDRCVLHQTRVAQLVRENRKLFLHKGAYHKFRGYAYQQLKKVQAKTPSNPKRQALVDAFGYDTKFAYHIVRLALECEEILTQGNLTLDANVAVLKAVREGQWTLERLEKWFEEKESQLEYAKIHSKLPEGPNYDVIKALLLQCLEQHYGDLSKAVTKDNGSQNVINEVQAVLDRYR